jgi:hypothetical protein
MNNGKFIRQGVKLDSKAMVARMALHAQTLCDVMG